MFLNLNDQALRQQEIQRLNDKSFRLSLALISSKYGTMFNKLSLMLIESIMVLNKKVDKDVFKAKMAKRVEAAMSTSYDDFKEELGNVTDLEDVNDDFADFSVAVDSKDKPITLSKKRKLDKAEESIDLMDKSDASKTVEPVKEIISYKIHFNFISLVVCMLVQFPIAMAMQYHVHFGTKLTDVDLGPSSTVFDLLISMTARGYGIGTFQEH